jgi:hypothetical protein
MIPPVKPALAKVTILSPNGGPWGWLITSAEVGDRTYVGSRAWRQQQLDPNRSTIPDYGSHP